MVEEGESVSSPMSACAPEAYEGAAEGGKGEGREEEPLAGMEEGDDDEGAEVEGGEEWGLRGSRGGEVEGDDEEEMLI